MNELEAIVIGGGQAGLAASRELSRHGIEHLVLERHRIGHGWAKHWASFCLVTPNWSAHLPDFPYDRDDPDSFMPRDDIVAYLERYARKFDLPVREGVDVRAVRQVDGHFEVATGAGDFRSRHLVLATGAFQEPHLPPGADGFADDLMCIDINSYDRPSDLPLGDVLVLGSGQSGCQLAEELTEDGRHVVLGCGRAPWTPRRINDKDIFWWLVESGFLDATVDSLPNPRARLMANILATGHGGGHDLHLRTLRAMGVELVGHFVGANGRKAHFKQDLGEVLAFSDDLHRTLMEVFTGYADKAGIAPPDVAEPEPFDTSTRDEVDLTGFGAVVVTSGFRPAFASWLPWSEAFDELGFPLQRDGTSSVIERLHFVGVHFLRKRKSALMIGVGEDAGVVATTVAEALA